MSIQDDSLIDNRILLAHNIVFKKEIERLNNIVDNTYKFMEELQTYGNDIYQRLINEKTKFDQAQSEYHRHINHLTEEFERQLTSLRMSIDEKMKNFSIKEEPNDNILEENQLKLAQYETEIFILRLKLSRKESLTYEHEQLIQKNQAIWKCIYEFEKKFKQY